MYGYNDDLGMRYGFWVIGSYNLQSSFAAHSMLI